MASEMASEMASDLDRADALISKLDTKLYKFKEACENPGYNMMKYEKLQEIRIGSLNADIDKMREDLDSFRRRLQASATSSEEHDADLKKKIAELETATQAASEREQQLFDAVKFAREGKEQAKVEKEQAKEEQEQAKVEQEQAKAEKAKAKERKAKAKEKKASAEEKDKAAESKRIILEKREEEVAKREEEVAKREEEIKKREKRAEKMEEEAKKRREEAEKSEEARLTKLDNTKKSLNRHVLKTQQDLGAVLTTLTKDRDSLREQCRLAVDSFQKASSTYAEIEKGMGKINEKMGKVNENRVHIGDMVQGIQARGSELAENMRNTKDRQSRFSADLQQLRQKVDDNKAWLAADENAAKQSVALLEKAYADVKENFENDVAELSLASKNAAELSLASKNLSRELADATAGIGGLKIATRAAKTLTTELVADFDSAGKRPLSSGVEPTGKRARSLGRVLPTGSPLDKDPRASVSSGRLIIPLRSQLHTTIAPGLSESTPDSSGSAPGPSGSRPGPSGLISGPSGLTPEPSGLTPGPSGSSNEPSSSNDPVNIYGLRPGFGICPIIIRDVDNEIQRTWAQIEFGFGWTMTDSVRLLEDFKNYAAKGNSRQTPQNTLDRCAEATGNNTNCLIQNFRKLGSNWNANEDKATKRCKDCTRRDQLCIRVSWASGIHGAYDRDATNVKRWNVTKRQL